LADLRTAEGDIADAQARANAAEQRFAAVGDLVARLFAEEKRQRILAASELWPQLPADAEADCPRQVSAFSRFSGSVIVVFTTAGDSGTPRNHWSR